MPEDFIGQIAVASLSTPEMQPSVVAVSRGADHGFSKPNEAAIRLIEGFGVEGDAHAGTTVKHRSRVRRDPTQPNLRQVHLIHEDLIDELREAGYNVAPGRMGENVTTRGIDLLGLARGTRLLIGPEAVIEVTGLRNPCIQLDRYQAGLMAATLDQDAEGNLVRKAGVMAIVITGGLVSPGDTIGVELPAGVHESLAPV
jgi:MOSC domain-containing protein YiiM